MKSLNIIGAGKVGQALGRLFAGHRVFSVQDIVTRSIAHSQAAAAFIGTGQPIAGLEQLRSADIYLLSVPDDSIASCCAELARLGHARTGSVFLHCSGALASTALATAAGHGAAIASVHPVRSFADPARVVEEFTGTYCGAEGDAAALALLEPAFSAIGARLIHIDAGRKTLYHAASVVACNYLATLIDVALDTYAAAGMSPEQARQLMEPLVRETLDNIFRLGPRQALTGPIARGDTETVARQQQALDEWDGQAGEVYRALAAATYRLAARPPDSPK